MDKQKALELLIQGIHVAQGKGAFNLEESKLLAEAVDVFTEKPKEEKKEKKK
tara:strand:- start:295 stop:450 length:156 start_codon:yes stop_codon:yes gene_type:complete